MLNVTNNTSNNFKIGTGIPKASGIGNMNRFKKPARKIFGLELRSLLAVIGITAFFLVAMISVAISLRQRFWGGTVAPNVADRSSAAGNTRSVCSLTFEVRDDTVASPSPSPSPSPSVSPSPSASPSPSPEIVSCGDACDEDNLCPNDHTCTGDKCVLNTCLVEGNTCNANKCQRTFDCQSRCENDNQCPTDHSCYDDPDDNKNYKICRLKTNLESESCQGKATVVKCGESCGSNVNCPNDHTCYYNKCVLNDCLQSGVSCTSNKCIKTTTTTTTTGTTTQQTVVLTSTPEPLAGCNDTCNTNSDCSANNHICYGNKCRLDENPSNEYCRSEEQMVAYSAPTTTKGGEVTTGDTAVAPGSSTQPDYPAELPETGPRDWFKIVATGGAIVIVGAALGLLLLI